MNKQQLEHWHLDAQRALPDQNARRLMLCIEEILRIIADVKDHHDGHKKVKNSEADRALWLKYGITSDCGIAICKNRNNELQKPVL